MPFTTLEIELAGPVATIWMNRPELHNAFDEILIAELIAACIAQTALDYDERGYGGEAPPLSDREIEENLWRAIRHGMSGKQIDFRRGEAVEARAALEELLAWVEPARAHLGVEIDLPERNGAQRAREALDSGVAIEDIYRDAVAETRRTYAGAEQAAERA